MKIKTAFILLFIATFISVSCKKESNTKYCWQVVDVFGQELHSVCNKTEPEMQTDYPNSCGYYKIGEEYCWLIDDSTFIPDRTEDYIARYIHCYGNFNSYRKVACDYCKRWFTRQKITYKPNNFFTFSPVYVKQYCGDTLHTLYQGRQIILRETADSLITIQFSNNGVFN